jgi:nicotinate-nucleotide adenylyltransferase
MKVGLYGGTFDPVHWGHILVAQAAREELGLDHVVFLPAAQSPFKSGLSQTPAPTRIRLLRLALAGLPYFQVDPCEILRGGVSYSIETVERHLQQNPNDDLFWLIGSDHVATLPQWRDANRLAGLVRFIVIPRPGTVVSPPDSRFRISWLRGWPLAISSSEIRKRAAEGLSLAGFVPSAVAEVIERDGLFANSSSHR